MCNIKFSVLALRKVHLRNLENITNCRNDDISGIFNFTVKKTCHAMTHF